MHHCSQSFEYDFVGEDHSEEKNVKPKPSSKKNTAKQAKPIIKLPIKVNKLRAYNPGELGIFQKMSLRYGLSIYVLYLYTEKNDTSRIMNGVPEITNSFMPKAQTAWTVFQILWIFVHDTMNYVPDFMNWNTVSENANKSSWSLIYLFSQCSFIFHNLKEILFLGGQQIKLAQCEVKSSGGNISFLQLSKA